ncbi:MAG: hypothetical protein JOZ21_05755 [Verrucomicrobia bacterium]|nr:hypothetical protein [Verrucomicrobiota bacterium]
MVSIDGGVVFDNFEGERIVLRFYPELNEPVQITPCFFALLSQVPDGATGSGKVVADFTGPRDLRLFVHQLRQFGRITGGPGFRSSASAIDLALSKGTPGNS